MEIKTAMAELRDKLQEVVGQAEYSQSEWVDGYKQAIQSVINDIDAQMLTQEHEMLYKAWQTGWLIDGTYKSFALFFPKP